MTKTSMIDKVEELLLQIIGVSSIEETHISKNKEKWLIITRKDCKHQVKTEVDRILIDTTLHIIFPKHNNQHGTLKREHRNPTIVYYDTALQKESKYESEIKML